MTKKVSKGNVLASLFWKLMEQFGTQGVQLLVQIVLARLLAPDDFGTITIVLVFINLAKVFVQSGLNTALIRKKDSDDTDFSSVFYVSLLVATFLYILLFVSAPWIAKFYNDPELTRILRVIALTLFPGALNSVQYAHISKNMLFKKLFFNSFAAALISGVLGIAAAYAGMGVWALVIQNLASQIAVSVIMWFTVKWRPVLKFSFARIKVLFSFGGKLLASSLLDSLYADLRSLIIGRMYSPASLGYFNRGQSVPRLLVKNLDGSIQSVMLPTLSTLQDDRDNMKRMVRRSIKTSSFIVFPVMAGLAVAAEPAIAVVLGDKWLPAVPFLQIFCLAFAVQPIHSANLQAINALGRSDIFLKLSVIKNVLGLIILAISVPFGIYAIAIGQIVSSLISALINAWPNKNLFGYSAGEQIRDILPALILAAAMALPVYLINFVALHNALTLLIQVLTGCIIYFGLAKLFKLESMTYITDTVKELLAIHRK